MKSVFRAIILGMGICVAAAGAAAAQDRVDAKKDWAIFVAGTGKDRVCWIVSQPTKKVAKNPAGETISVNRSEIFLMVSVRKAEGVKNEISFLSGYPFKKGSEVKVSVKSRAGQKNFKLFTHEENAWTPSAEEDDALTAAMRAGSEALIEGVSGRGNTTVDTFSLSGFTAALKSAVERCK